MIYLNIIKKKKNAARKKMSLQIVTHFIVKLAQKEVHKLQIFWFKKNIIGQLFLKFYGYGIWRGFNPKYN